MTQRSAVFCIAFFIIVGAIGAVQFLKTNQKLGKPGVKIGSEPILDSADRVVSPRSIALPHTILGGTSQTMPITSQELQYLPKDTTYGRRLYLQSDGFKAILSAVLMGTDRTSIHKPEFCLPGQGWSVISQQETSINIDSPMQYRLPVMKWFIGRKAKDQSGQIVDVRGVYVFWFVSEHQITPHHSGRMTSIAKHLIATGELERWAYVACFSPCSPGQEDATFARIQQLVAAAVPEFQLTTGGAESSSGSPQDIKH